MLKTMTNSHVSICLHHADMVDPSRGGRWKEAFDEKAKSLGYTIAVTYSPAQPQPAVPPDLRGDDPAAQGDR
jgi:hypothetical protein